MSLEIRRGPAARDFGSGQGGEAGGSPRRAVPAEPTQAAGKRSAAGPRPISKLAHKSPPQNRARALGLLLALSLIHPFSQAASLTEISLPAAADTSLLEWQPDFNLGRQEDLPSGTLGASAGFTQSRLLLRFDLAQAVPSGAFIRGASIRLTVTRKPDDGGVNSIFALHRLLRPWNEGGKSGGLPGGSLGSPGETTWNSRILPDAFWEQPGARPEIDYAAAPSSTERVLQEGAYEFELGLDQLETLANWASKPETNFGWILLSQAEGQPKSARRFGAREHPIPSSRPSLKLLLEIPDDIPAPVITRITRVNSQTQVTVQALAGIRYQLQFTDDLRPLDWSSTAPPEQAQSSGDLVLTDATGPTTHRFYRVAATRFLEPGNPL